MTDLALQLGNYTADLIISNQDLATDQGIVLKPTYQYLLQARGL